jgi:hypothetical protein
MLSRLRADALTLLVLSLERHMSALNNRRSSVSTATTNPMGSGVRMSSIATLVAPMRQVAESMSALIARPRRRIPPATMTRNPLLIADSAVARRSTARTTMLLPTCDARTFTLVLWACLRAFAYNPMVSDHLLLMRVRLLTIKQPHPTYVIAETSLVKDRRRRTNSFL